MVAFALFAAAAVGLPAETVQALEARRAEIERRPGAVMPAGAPVLPVEAGVVAGSRGSAGAGPLTLPLVISTGGLPAGAFVRRHEIVRAVDDLDRPILPSTNPGVNSTLQPRGDGPRVTRNLVLQPPQPGAKSIKLAEGYLEIFVPAEETGSLVRFSGVGGRAGERLQHALLTASGIEVTVLGKEQYDGLKPQWEKSYASVAAEPNFATTAVFLVKDRSGRLIGAELRDGAGAALPGSTQVLSTNVLGTALVTVRASAPLPPGAEVRFFLADPRALSLFRFRLENVPLPQPGVRGLGPAGQ